MPASRPPNVTKVIRLQQPSDLDQPKRGRPKKLKFPALPQEILDGMTPLEKEHFAFFIDSHLQQYPDLIATDYIGLYAAAMEYIAYLRLQAQQLATGELITQSRQHPGVQLRAWLDSLSVTRKQRGPKKEEDPETAALLKAFVG